MQLFTSQITFMYFNNFESGRKFLGDILGLESVYDPGWATVYAASDKAYLGAVDNSSGSMSFAAHGGTLVSLTTDDVEGWHKRLDSVKGIEISAVKAIPDVGLKSFFIHGPEDYCFEIQQFDTPMLRKLF